MGEKLMKTIYFCFGDYRSGKKEYRIFKVRDIEDAYKVADTLGYEVNLDSCFRPGGISDHTERMVVSVLNTLEIKLNMFENVVACYRAEYDEAQRMKRHFLDTDIKEYFPKILAEPIRHDVGIVKTQWRREYPWIHDYWDRKYKRGELKSLDLVAWNEETQAMLNAAIREKAK